MVRVLSIATEAMPIAKAKRNDNGVSVRNKLQCTELLEHSATEALDIDLPHALARLIADYASAARLP